MKKSKIQSPFKIIWLGAILMTGFVACEDLEVENLNEPNQDQIYSLPEEYLPLIESSYATWWNALEKSDPNWGLSVAGESMTSSWGNWAAQDLGTIPRQQLQNNLTYSNRAVMTTPWNTLNSALATTNAIMRKIVVDNIPVIDGAGEDRTQEALALGRGMQGLALGALGMLFDQAYILDENSDLEQLEFLPYDQVISASRQKLSEAIQIASSNTFTVNILNSEWSSAQLAQYFSTMSAKIEAFSARNAQETTANVNWEEILQLTNNGISTDISVLGDGGSQWWNRIKLQGQDPGWAFVSSRIVNMMDDRMPYPWPTGVNSVAVPSDPKDDRMATDYKTSAPPFQAARGYYFFSMYYYQRFQSYRANLNTEIVHMLVAENDLLKAEALVRTGGSKVTAANLINETRVERGGLAPLTGSESNDVLLAAIVYERLAELPWTNTLTNGFFIRRGTTVTNMQLLPGTIPHLPVPAQELELFGLPYYSFGGE
ncbi:hypothetical protein [Peijinzhouia sedimentorum]